MKAIKIGLYVVFVFLLNSTVFSGDDVESTATPAEIELMNTDVLSAVNELMLVDEDCQLPCFWTFIAGNSSLDDVDEFWMSNFETPIRTTVSETENEVFATFYTNFVPQNARTDLFVTMTFRDEILWLLEISTANADIWLKDDWLPLKYVSQQLDEDDVEYYVGVRRGQIVLILLDKTSNIMIQKSYSFQPNSNLSSDNDTPLQLCPTSDNLIDTSLWLLNDDTMISIEEIVGNPTFPGSQLASYEPIEVMSGLNSDEFKDFIQESPENCVDLLSYAQLIELGYGF